MKVEVRYPDEFDEALRETTRAGEEIHLRSGVGYVTAGNWTVLDSPWCNLARGVSIFGNGATLSLRNPVGADRPDRDVNLIWGAGDNLIHDLTFDGSQAGAGLHVGGIRILGRYDIKNVEVRGLRGTWNGVGTLHKEIEVFPFVGFGPGGTVQNFRVRNCSPNSYVSGVYLVKGGYARDLDIDLGGGNWFALSGGEDCTFRRAKIRGAKIVLYNDTGPTDKILLDEIDAEGAVTVVSLVTTDGSAKGHVAIRDSTFSLTPDAAGDARLVERIDKSTTPRFRFSHVLFSGCDIASTASRTHAAPTVGAADPVIFDGCMLPENLIRVGAIVNEV